MSQTAKADPRGTPSQDHHTPSGFSPEHRPDPSNPLVSEFGRGAVPEGLVTRRQLRDMGLSPGGNNGPVAILRCKWCSHRPQWSCTHPTRGFLLRVDLAKPKRVPTLAQEWALDRAMAARPTCSECGRRFHICLSWPGTPAPYRRLHQQPSENRSVSQRSVSPPSWADSPG
ncbi:RRQRL motif-containing zinc-binding protein [Streptomyces xiangluensis]|uniref:RRQRL motif-containing zinc-binding protein n=1 Tax=Streptomyces xiangluensis TaxID=2665720 RepID=A0ABV8YQ14_9ACTN